METMVLYNTPTWVKNHKAGILRPSALLEPINRLDVLDSRRNYYNMEENARSFPHYLVHMCACGLVGMWQMPSSYATSISTCLVSRVFAKF